MNPCILKQLTPLSYGPHLRCAVSFIFCSISRNTLNEQHVHHQCVSYLTEDLHLHYIADVALGANRVRLFKKPGIAEQDATQIRK